MQQEGADAIGVLDDIKGLCLDLLGFIPGIGKAISTAIEVAIATLKATLKHWYDNLSFLAKIWAIFCEVLDELGIPNPQKIIEGCKKVWGAVKKVPGAIKREVYNTIHYGGKGGEQLKKAVALFSEAQKGLKYLASKLPEETYLTYIATMYRGYLPSKHEIEKERKFCNDVLKFYIPSYDEAIRKRIYSGISRAKDDGTYGERVLSDFASRSGWNVLRDNTDAPVNSWFIKSCRVLTCSVFTLQSYYNAIYHRQRPNMDDHRNNLKNSPHINKNNIKIT